MIQKCNNGEFINNDIEYRNKSISIIIKYVILISFFQILNAILFKFSFKSFYGYFYIVEYNTFPYCSINKIFDKNICNIISNYYFISIIIYIVFYILFIYNNYKDFVNNSISRISISILIFLFLLIPWIMSWKMKRIDLSMLHNGEILGHVFYIGFAGFSLFFIMSFSFGLFKLFPRNR